MDFQLFLFAIWTEDFQIAMFFKYMSFISAVLA